jgi:hypothetical protein
VGCERTDPIERRREPLDGRDRRELIAGQHAGLVTRGLPYRHDIPKQEPLLWIADAVVGAAAASRVDNEPRYLCLLPTQCQEIKAIPAP